MKDEREGGEVGEGSGREGGIGRYDRACKKKDWVMIKGDD